MGGVENIDLNSYASQNVMPQSVEQVINTVKPHKPPPKMQRLSGHLWELVVTYQNRTTGGLFQEDVWTYLLYGR